jgi:hypothetical protein
MDMAINAPSAQMNDREHEQTYRKFVKLARAAACAAPFLVAFVLYWTT